MKRFSLTLLGLAAAACASLTAFAGVNTWTNIGPDGGNVTKLVFHPTDPNTLFALTLSGAYRSVNSGESWQRVQGYVYPTAFVDLEIDPSNPARVYLVGGAMAPQVSADGGATFAALTALPNAAGDAANVELSADGAIVYLAGADRVYRSTDHGSTWSTRGQLHGVGGRIFSLLIDAADVNTLYALAETTPAHRGLYLSEDGGDNWQLLQDTSGSNTIQSFAVSKNPRRLWTARLDNLYVSTDQGRNSIPVAFNTPTNAITVDPANADTLYAGDLFGRVSRSDDAGLHWTDITANLLIGQGQGIYLHPLRPTEMYVGGQDLARTTNAGASWSTRHAGIRAARVPSFSANAARSRVYLNPSMGGVHFLEGGASVTAEVNNAALAQTIGQVTPSILVFPYAQAVHAQEGAPGRVFAAFTNDVLRSVDGGTTWQALNFPTPHGTVALAGFASSPAAPNVIYAGTFESVLRTVDGGDHWSEVTAGLPTGAGMSIVVAAASDKAFVYGAPFVVNPVMGQPPLGQGVYRWNETKAQWEAASSGMGNVRVSDLAVHPTDPKLAVAVTTTGLMKTTDGGSSWTALAWDGSDFDGTLARVAFDPVNPRIIYAANNAHIIRSVTGGTSWETLLDLVSFTRQTVAMTADPSARGSLLVGTAAESAFQLTIAPDLALEMKGPPAESVKDTAVGYELTLRNLGAFHATGVKVIVPMPASANGISMGVIAGSGFSCQFTAPNVTCSTDVLRAGSSSTINLHAIPTSTGTFALTATISAAENDPVSGNNSVSASTNVSAAPPPASSSSSGGGGGGGALSLDLLLALALLVVARLYGHVRAAREVSGP